MNNKEIAIMKLFKSYLLEDKDKNGIKDENKDENENTYTNINTNYNIDKESLKKRNLYK